MNGERERLHTVELNVAVLEERLNFLATKDDMHKVRQEVASVKVWFVVTAVALSAAVATIAAAIAS